MKHCSWSSRAWPGTGRKDPCSEAMLLASLGGKACRFKADGPTSSGTKCLSSHVNFKWVNKFPASTLMDQLQMRFNTVQQHSAWTTSSISGACRSQLTQHMATNPLSFLAKKNGSKFSQPSQSHHQDQVWTQWCRCLAALLSSQSSAQNARWN